MTTDLQIAREKASLNHINRKAAMFIPLRTTFCYDFQQQSLITAAFACNFVHIKASNTGCSQITSIISEQFILSFMFCNETLERVSQNFTRISFHCCNL